MMITSEKLKIYKSYNGDIDGFTRTYRSGKKIQIEDSDWYMIDQFLQDLNLINKNLASKTFAEDVQKRLTENCNNEETVEQIKALSFAGKKSQPDGFVQQILNLFKSKKR